MAKACPHCNHEIPAGMEIMPVCVICGGDINAQPTQTWTTLDIQNQGQQTYHCHACGTAIASVLTTECPSCGTALELARTAGSTSPTAASEPEPPSEPALPSPVIPQPVAPAPEPVRPVSLPDFVEHPASPPEPVAPPAVPLPPAARAAQSKSAASEGFFSKILRMLGLKK